MHQSHGSVGIVSFTLCLPPPSTSPCARSWANYSSTRRRWICLLRVFGGGTSVHITCPSIRLYSKAPPRVAAKPSASAGASRASPFHLYLAVQAAFVFTRLVTAAPPSRSQSLRFWIHQRGLLVRSGSRRRRVDGRHPQGAAASGVAGTARVGTGKDWP